MVLYSNYRFRESKNKKPNTKPRQFEIIVNFMKGHPELAKGQLNGLAAKQKSNHLWARLIEDLNLSGPPTHTVVEWKKVIYKSFKFNFAITGIYFLDMGRL